MIKFELLKNETLIQHYSDLGVYLLQNETGKKYLDPIDIYPCPYTYTETDEFPEEYTEEISSEELQSMIEEVL